MVRDVFSLCTRTHTGYSVDPCGASGGDCYEQKRPWFDNPRCWIDWTCPVDRCKLKTTKIENSKPLGPERDTGNTSDNLRQRLCCCQARKLTTQSQCFVQVFHKDCEDAGLAQWRSQSCTKRKGALLLTDHTSHCQASYNAKISQTALSRSKTFYNLFIVEYVRRNNFLKMKTLEGVLLHCLKVIRNCLLILPRCMAGLKMRANST